MKTYFRISILFCSSLFVIPLKAKPESRLNLWISSFQDQVYYEKMASLFSKDNPEFNLEVTAYGFREMPDKLGVALRSGKGIPDMVQLDETFFWRFSQWTVSIS